MDSYDKLGELLKDAIESGNFPKAEKKSQKTKAFSIKQDETFAKDNTKNEKLLKFEKQFLLLGIEPTENIEEIKKAGHKMLKKYHPDNVPKLKLVQKTAAAKTQEILEAYRILLANFS